MNWPTSSLDELTEQERRITYGVVKPGDEDPVNGILFVRGGDIFDGQIAVDKLRTITQDVSNQYRRTLLRGGELLISLVGNPGAVAMVPPKLAGANIARQAGLVALKEGINHKYVEWFLRSPAGQAAMGLYITGAVQKVINLADLKRVRVPIPPVDTQRRIASILSAYDDLIENNTRRIAILEEMARRIYEEWFVRFRFPGHEQVKMVESELGLIPEGWSVEKVASVVQRLPAGQTYKKESVAESGSVMVVDQSTSDYLGFHDLDVDHPASVNAPRIIFGDHTCKLKLMLRPFSVGPNTITFVGTGGLDSIYVFQLVQGLVQTREYKRHWTDFSDKQVVLCEKELASRYGDAVRGFFHLAQVLDDKNRTLRATRDLLLPKLISGELDVSTLPEPEEAIAA